MGTRSSSPSGTLPEADQALWEAFTKTVTPLGQARPSQALPALPIVRQEPPARSLDLHGLTVAEAHAATLDYLESARAAHKSVMVVTGLSGQIKREFEHWFSNHSTVTRLEEMNGGGAYRIYFKRTKR